MRDSFLSVFMLKYLLVPASLRRCLFSLLKAIWTVTAGMACCVTTLITIDSDAKVRLSSGESNRGSEKSFGVVIGCVIGI